MVENAAFKFTEKEQKTKSKEKYQYQLKKRQFSENNKKTQYGSVEFQPGLTENTDSFIDCSACANNFKAFYKEANKIIPNTKEKSKKKLQCTDACRIALTNLALNRTWICEDSYSDKGDKKDLKFDKEKKSNQKLQKNQSDKKGIKKACVRLDSIPIVSSPKDASLLELDAGFDVAAVWSLALPRIEGRRQFSDAGGNKQNKMDLESAVYYFVCLYV